MSGLCSDLSAVLRPRARGHRARTGMDRAGLRSAAAGRRRRRAGRWRVAAASRRDVNARDHRALQCAVLLDQRNQRRCAHRCRRLLLARGVAGSYQLVRAGIPILGALAATSAALAIPLLVRHSRRRSWPGWLVEVSSGITRARRSILRPSWRLLGAAGYLGFDIAALGATFAAAGHPLPVAPLVLGYLT